MLGGKPPAGPLDRKIGREYFNQVPVLCRCLKRNSWTQDLLSQTFGTSCSALITVGHHSGSLSILLYCLINQMIVRYQLFYFRIRNTYKQRLTPPNFEFLLKMLSIKTRKSVKWPPIFPVKGKLPSGKSTKMTSSSHFLSCPMGQLMVLLDHPVIKNNQNLIDRWDQENTQNRPLLSWSARLIPVSLFTFSWPTAYHCFIASCSRRKWQWFRLLPINNAGNFEKLSLELWN